MTDERKDDVERKKEKKKHISYFFLNTSFFANAPLFNMLIRVVFMRRNIMNVIQIIYYYI